MTGLILALLLQAAPAENVPGSDLAEEWPRPIPHMTSTPELPPLEGEKDGCAYLYIWQRDEEYQRVAICVTISEKGRGLTFTLEEKP